MTRYKIGDRVKNDGFKVGDLLEFIDQDGQFAEVRVDVLMGLAWGQPPSGAIIAAVEVIAEDEKGLDIRIDYEAAPAAITLVE
jgi:hypothetical protein